MRIPSAAVLLLTAGLAFGHSDPWGETHPHVAANQDGSFTVTFVHSILEQKGRMRMMVGADGKEVVPRHWIERTTNLNHVEIYQEPSSDIRSVETGGDKSRSLLVKPAKAGGAELEAARVVPIELSPYVRETRTAGRELAATFGDVEERTDYGMPFKLACCRSDGFQPGRTVTLGTVACIYDFPSASPQIWSAGRWWIAWVEVRKKEDVFTFTTVLSSVDPESGKVEHHKLPGISNWNTHLDIAVNAAGTFCVAWHASLDGSYPGTAKIVIAVFTPGK